MSRYTQELQALEDRRCPTCYGLGECDDADMGDISFNTWQCKSCGGTGLKDFSPQEKQIHRMIDAWESLPGGRQVKNSDVERWLNGAMASSINEARTFLGRPKPEVAT